jgi:adenosylcobinamide-GDP ribazoletransferase
MSGGFHQAVAFLTPLGGPAAPTPRALPWFGLVGALIGGVVGAVWWAADQWFAALVAAAIAITADAALTGLLHLDGLSDSADGLLPPLATERRLAVMRDPHAGSFGIVAIVLALILRISVLASVTPGPGSILALAAVWATARTAMAFTAVTMPYVRPAGLATAFLEGHSPQAGVLCLAGGMPLALVLGALGTDPSARGVLAVAAAAIGAAIVVTFSRGRIGGFTGDVLGAAGVTAEITGLILLAVRV